LPLLRNDLTPLESQLSELPQVCDELAAGAGAGCFGSAGAFFSTESFVK
jgi:hypothetical protein